MNRILILLAAVVVSLAEGQTFRTSFKEKQRQHAVSLKDKTIKDEFNPDKVGVVCAQGVAYLEEIEKFLTTNEVALNSLKCLKMLPVTGELIFSLVTLFMDVPDPALEKLDQIQNALTNMQDRMLNEFQNVQRSINSVDCKGRLSEYKNVIHVAFKEALNYGNEKNKGVKEIYKESLFNALFDIKAALNYMVSSVIS